MTDTPLSVLVTKLSTEVSFRRAWLRPEGSETSIKRLVEGVLFMADANKALLADTPRGDVVRSGLVQMAKAIHLVMDPENGVPLGRFDRQILGSLLEDALGSVGIELSTW